VIGVKILFYEGLQGDPHILASRINPLGKATLKLLKVRKRLDRQREHFLFPR
jgi:hypothetical protein